MKEIAIYSIVSPIHNKEDVERTTNSFLKGLGIDYTLYNDDYSTYASFGNRLNLIYIGTGGTEEIFLNNLKYFEKKGKIYLLASQFSNSLAASMEILSYLKMNGLEGEIIHGSSEYVRKRIEKLATPLRLGVVGKPSNWLISSGADYPTVLNKFGIDLVDIPMEELISLVKGDVLSEEQIENIKCNFANIPFTANCRTKEQVESSKDEAVKIYLALKKIIEDNSLNGVTVRCFDLLSSVGNTGCLALSLLNSENYVAGCEGDIPAALSMMISKKLLGVSGFQANPSKIDIEKGEILFAHCTIPISLVESYQFDSHFESGIGVAIRGFLKKGEVTILKVAADLSRYFVEEGTILDCGESENLCRTQLLIRVSNRERANYFLNNPIGNHHIIIPGNHKSAIEKYLNTLK